VQVGRRNMERQTPGHELDGWAHLGSLSEDQDFYHTVYYRAQFMEEPCHIVSP